mgnify:CR=1 FL=1
MPGLALLSTYPDYLLLLFIRVSGIMIGSPVFGRKQVPNLLKICFSVSLALVFVAGSPAPAVHPAYANLPAYVLLCLRELLFGTAMGFVLTAMFNLVFIAGSLMDYQIGLSMSSIFDLQNNMQTPVSGALFNLALLLMFFALDGHLKLIEVIFRSLEACPVGMAMAPPEILWVAADVISSSFTLAVMLAMPVIAAGMMTEIALGVIVKNVPQLNMFVVGIPLKMIVGLVMLGVTLTLFGSFTKIIFNKAFDYIGLMFNYLQGIG